MQAAIKDVRGRSTGISGSSSNALPMNVLSVVGARTHNLKDISVKIPHNQLTVITGVSGSGKSSLAFDTISAEGQRQYIESLSTYARQFLNQLQRPDVDSIEGLQPTLCIDQRIGAASPRSTVATVTEVYDYLRLMMARVGTPHCFQCGEAIVQQSPDQIHRTLASLPEGTKLVLMAPVVRGRRGGHRDVLQTIQKAGLLRVRVDNQLYDIESVPELEVRKNHSIEAVVDKIVIRPDNHDRLGQSIAVALKLASGLVSASYLVPASVADSSVADSSVAVSDAASTSENLWIEQLFSTQYACATCGTSLEEIEPRTFSFNSPYGSCPTCDGVGRTNALDPNSLVTDWALAPSKGAFAFLEAAPASIAKKLKRDLKALVESLGLTWSTALDGLEQAKRTPLIQGSKGVTGVVELLSDMRKTLEPDDQAWLDNFCSPQLCPTCQGARLRPEALSVRLNGKNIAEICQQNIAKVLPWFETLQLTEEKLPIAKPILAEMLHRLRFLDRVGVGYLTLARSADSLSGGELQRVRLATSIGSGLVGVCYILDEPSIGLHQRDNDRLIDSLRNLQQQGNTVVVVEHDDAMMRAADCLIDIGPGAGKHGGNIIAIGAPADVENCTQSLTGAYLRGEQVISEPRQVRTPTKGNSIKLLGASLHNLKTVDVELPLGLLIGITGVSGSGKSSLIGETFVPAILKHIGQSPTARPGPFKQLLGVERVDKLIELTQDPIGRTPRSTPATYCGVFDLIRTVWASTRESKSRGFTASRFSFNAGDGRCPACQGQGQEKIEMNFLPDLYVTCSVCNGLRYNRQTLQVRYREKTIADALAMSIDEAATFFENFEKIHRLLSTLQQVGLGYLSLGQCSNTLSGGEAQRIKLASELARPETGKTIYFLDEPTTGLHFDDVRRLVNVLNGLVERGNTVIVIEHNVDVIRACDWLIDLGPDGGDAGGEIVAVGSPKDVAKNQHSLTGRYL
ncbi:MAG: excinuclease ABC subunit UvrA [Pirellulales bacterium]